MIKGENPYDTVKTAIYKALRQKVLYRQQIYRVLISLGSEILIFIIHPSP